MIRAGAVMAMGLAMAATGCSGGASGEGDLEGERMAITRTVEAWEAAAAREDASALAELYTRDAVFLPPGLPALEGRDAIRELMEQQFAAADLEADFTTEEIVVAGEWAFRRGSYVARGTAEGASDTLESRAKFLEVWRRDEDGRWRIARDIWNENPAAGDGP